MTRVLDWCGFFGAWLLFAGPVYQAQTELDEEAREGEEFMEAAHSVQAPPSPSVWWWLLPPVAVYLRRRHSREIRRRVREVLSPAQIEQFVRFSEKATGWLFVAAGAGLIALKETWSLVHAYAWSTVVFWVLVAVMLALSLTWTFSRARRRHAILGIERRSPRGRDSGD